MNSISIFHDIAEATPNSVTMYENVEDVAETLFEHFKGTWPDTAKLYFGQVSDMDDVTPRTPADIEKLKTLTGKFYVVIYPGYDWIVYIVIAIVAYAAATLIMKPPNAALRNTSAASPNNELSERTNRARPNGRIPDIMGTVRSTPDLIALPYSVYENHREIEFCLMCIGRGKYDVLAANVRDDTTKISNIPGASVQIYAPFTSPNSGTAQLTIGAPITEPMLDTKKSNAVNGQVLRPPNDLRIVGDRNITFEAPNQINSAAFDFTTKFEVGDMLTVTDAAVVEGSFAETQTIRAHSDGFFTYALPDATPPPYYNAGQSILLSGAQFTDPGSDYPSGIIYDLSGVYLIDAVSVIDDGMGNYRFKIELVDPAASNPRWNDAIEALSASTALSTATGGELYNLAGTYEILTVSAHNMTLDSPELVNADWDDLTGESPALSATLFTSGIRWVGPFIIDKPDMTKLINNFVAVNGLYKDDGSNQYSVEVELEIEATPVDSDGTPTGPAELSSATIVGSAETRDTRAITLRTDLAEVGSYSIRARRITETDIAFAGTVVDEIKWRNLTGAVEILDEDFGNITMLQSSNYATDGALAIKERKLNALVTRMIPQRDGDTFTEELFASNNVADIFCFAALDPYIGGRTIDELDLDNIYDTVDAVIDYFGITNAAEFCYTFDADNLSFEETGASIARAAFCEAFRRGEKFRFFFERATVDAAILGCHRNKVPHSEQRNVRFGPENDIDGIAFSYVRPTDDAIETLYIPADRSAVKEKRVESIGIRNTQQAYLQAWRIYNKIKYQNTTSKFSGLQEFELLVRNETFLNADNTRSKSQDGEIVSQDGLLLRLSQPMVFEDGKTYKIFLQLANATTQAVDITATSDKYVVLLEDAPAIPLVLDRDKFVKTLYMIVADDDSRQTMFIMTDRQSTEDALVSEVTAINYDDRYYEKDLDFAP